jgi:hypothetical protein
MLVMSLQRLRWFERFERVERVERFERVEWRMIDAEIFWICRISCDKPVSSVMNEV